MELKQIDKESKFIVLWKFCIRKELNNGNTNHLSHSFAYIRLEKHSRQVDNYHQKFALETIF